MLIKKFYLKWLSTLYILISIFLIRKVLKIFEVNFNILIRKRQSSEANFCLTESIEWSILTSLIGTCLIAVIAMYG